MAKTFGPLHSFSAAGTVGASLTFRRFRGATVAERTPRPPAAQSAAQAAHRQTISDAATAWRSLTETDRDEWLALAIANGGNPYLLFAREWQIQQSTSDNPPACPALPPAP